MKKSRYTDSHILEILEKAEAGAPAPRLCREHSMISATFYGGELSAAAWRLR